MWVSLANWRLCGLARLGIGGRLQMFQNGKQARGQRGHIAPPPHPRYDGGGAKKRRASWAPVRIGGLVGPLRAHLHRWSISNLGARQRGGSTLHGAMEGAELLPRMDSWRRSWKPSKGGSTGTQSKETQLATPVSSRILSAWCHGLEGAKLGGGAGNHQYSILAGCPIKDGI